MNLMVTEENIKVILRAFIDMDLRSHLENENPSVVGMSAIGFRVGPVDPGTPIVDSGGLK